MYRWRARAANDKLIHIQQTATHVIPVVIERNVVAEDAGSHDVVQLGKLDLSRALQELGVRLDQLHGLDILGSGNVALVNSLHLFAMRICFLEWEQHMVSTSNTIRCSISTRTLTHFLTFRVETETAVQ